MKTAFFFLYRGAVLAAICVGAGGLAQAAGTLTAQQAVRAVISTSCTASVGTALAFNTLNTTPMLAINLTDATGTITVSCTSGTSYSVSIGNGNNYDSSAGMLRMVNGSSQYLKYRIYKDSSRFSVFPLSGTGIGSAQTVTAYGRVFNQTAGGFGNFTDSVIFTITY